MKNKSHYIVKVGKIFVASGYAGPKIPEFNSSPDKAYPFSSFQAAENSAILLGGDVVEVATTYRIINTAS